jgi:hypothetical protein
MGLFSRKEKVAEKVEEESLCAFLFKDNRREQALNKIYEKYNAGANKFLINGSYYDIPLNDQLPKDTEAWKLYDMSRVYLGTYNDAGFYECCEIDSAEGYLDVTKYPRHTGQHIKNFQENVDKRNVWKLFCLNNENINKITFMNYLAAIKYPKVLDDFFINYKDDINEGRGALEKNYSQLPWTLMEAKNFSAYSNDPNTNSIYQFIKHFPTEFAKSFWVSDSWKLEEVLYEIEQKIMCGANQDIIKEIWEYSKIELPKAFNFNKDYSWEIADLLR